MNPRRDHRWRIYQSIRCAKVIETSIAPWPPDASRTRDYRQRIQENRRWPVKIQSWRQHPSWLPKHKRKPDRHAGVYHTRSLSGLTLFPLRNAPLRPLDHVRHPARFFPQSARCPPNTRIRICSGQPTIHCRTFGIHSDLGIGRAPISITSPIPATDYGR